MAYCGNRPGLCGHRSDCPDTHCPGRFEAIGYESMLGLHVTDGGHSVSGDDSMRVPAPRLRDRAQRHTDKAARGRRIGGWLAFGGVCLFAAAAARYFLSLPV